MRNQLQQYVALLFAGTANCEEIQQEILQNTLDRYDDLIAEGKVPEAAYRLAIAGIGDIQEILKIQDAATPAASSASGTTAAPVSTDTPTKKLLRAIAIGLYILSPSPLFILSEFGMSTLGLCATLVIVAVATVLILIAKPDSAKEPRENQKQQEHPAMKTVETVLTVLGLIVYFPLSFSTKAWHITWLVFPITAVIEELIRAILDYKEACKHET
ncbi:MAG: hypothetical protein J6V25_08765 [Oscillospiraceae bacterium]|nr:hypothetical protein [Oscillospiraceae bacterium]